MNRSVAGVLVDKGLIFLARRNGTGQMDGRWELPGGKCEDGENAVQALQREFLEEFGMEIDVGPLCGEAFFEHRGVEHRVEAYRIRSRGAIAFLAEHSEVQWFSFDNLPPENETVDSDVQLLRQIPRPVRD